MNSTQGYAWKFRRHVQAFMDSHGLWPEGKVAYVAISGGVDSLCLLHTLIHLKRAQDFCWVAVSIDHHSRPESSRDLEFCQRQCAQWGVAFKSFQLPQKVLSNREHHWRELRRDIFRNLLSSGEVLYQGHHLNDSLEWNLLGQLKSSGQNIPGIPLVNGGIRRPFLCVSKAQILHYAQCENISFVEDVTNQDWGFERNYLRRSIALWERRFPKYLKHYAQRQNDWAQGRGVHVLGEAGEFRRLRDAWGGELFWSWTKLGGEGLRQHLIRGVWELSSKSRGSLGKEITKLLQARRGQGRGPMCFPGGILAYWDRNLIYLMSHSVKGKRESLAHLQVLGWRRYGGLGQFQQFYRSQPHLLSLPLYLAHQRPKGVAVSREHPLFGPLMGLAGELGAALPQQRAGEGGCWSSPLRLAAKVEALRWPLEVWQWGFGGAMMQDLLP